jgi:alkylated DNA nucleotide flippase Atl1
LPTNPEVRLARSIGEALRVYAEEKAHQENEFGAQPDPIAEDVALPTPRGPRQRDIAEVLLGASIEGWKTGEIARLVDMDQPNAYLALQALQKQEVVEMVPGSDPQRWRLLPRYRQRQQIVQAAAMVCQGEFTTYGDISQAVYGHGRGGLAVGRLAATFREFPRPHRVLAKGGQISPQWAFPDGTGGPEDAERLLDDDGVEVLHDNGIRYAHPRHYVDHEELGARLRGRRSDWSAAERI